MAITYDELKNCEDRLEHSYRDVSPPGLHPPLTVTTWVDGIGWQMWRQTWLDLRGKGIPHEAAIRQVENEIDVIEGRPPRWPEEPDPFPPEPPQPVARGPLGMDGDRCYTLQGRPVLPIGVHFGEAFSLWCHDREATVLTELDDMAEAGYHFLRTWLTLPDTEYWDGRGVGPNLTTDYWPRMHDFVREVQARGLLLHTACGDLVGYSDSQETAIFQNLAQLIRTEGDQWVALIEGLNEARDTGDADDQDPAEIARLVKIVHDAHPHLLTALSAYTGTEEETTLADWTPDWQRLTYVHGYRGGHFWDKLRHIFSLAYESMASLSVEARALRGRETPLSAEEMALEISLMVEGLGASQLRRLGWQGEPFGPGASVSCVSYPEEMDAETMALAAAQALASRQAFAFHQDSGAIYRERIKDQPGYYEIPAMARELPADVMTWPRLFHGGTAWASQRILEAVGEVRVDHTVSDDGRFVIKIYGPSGTYRLPVARGFSAAVYDPRAPSDAPQAILGHAGEQLQLSFTRGRVLMGQLT